MFCRIDRRLNGVGHSAVDRDYGTGDGAVVLRAEPADRVDDFGRFDEPRGFLARFPDDTVLDEIQHTPDLLSYIQVLDDDRRNGRFVLTGSEQFGLTSTISQSLFAQTPRAVSLLMLRAGESEEVCEHFADLLQCDRSDVRAGRLNDSVDADSRR